MESINLCYFDEGRLGRTMLSGTPTAKSGFHQSIIMSICMTYAPISGSVVTREGIDVALNHIAVSSLMLTNHVI